MKWIPKFLRDKFARRSRSCGSVSRNVCRKRLPQADGIRQYDAAMSAWLRSGREGPRPQR